MKFEMIKKKKSKVEIDSKQTYLLLHQSSTCGNRYFEEYLCKISSEDCLITENNCTSIS